MIDVLSRLRNTAKRLLQEMGREPTTEETAAAAGISLEETRRVLDIGRHPVSLDRPIGESEDGSFGEFIEDHGSGKPLQVGDPMDCCVRKIEDAAQDAHLSGAGDHPPPLRAGRRLFLHPRRGGPDLQGHPRTGPADRGQGGRQAAASGPQPATGRLPASNSRVAGRLN